MIAMPISNAGDLCAPFQRPDAHDMTSLLQLFTGPIPKELGQLTLLNELRLNDNQLTGTSSAVEGKI